MPRKPSFAAPQETVSAPSGDLTLLPAQVAAIRVKILEACAVGDIEALRVPIDWNETRPLFERSGLHPAGTDPIIILKSLSADGKGRETLRILTAVLTLPYVVAQRGPFISYEWPAYARAPAPPPPETLPMLWACVRFSDLSRSNAQGRPQVCRLGVGADGTWHYFWSEGI